MAHEYRAGIAWSRGDQAFLDQRYSRAHVWRFDGGVEVEASSAPSSVPLPFSKPDAVDPEEALAASAASCHMLFFLHLAAKQGFRVDSYADDAVAVMTKNAAGKLYVSTITLNPKIVFSGARAPGPEEVAALHHHAHDECYIANSLKGEIVLGAPTFSIA